METPASPTIKSMASIVLKGLGDPIYSKGTHVQLTERISVLMKEQNVRMLIFDEFQNLIDRDSEKLSDKAANWLKELINDEDYKVSIVIVGLERTKKLFENDQLRSRFWNPVRMREFNWNDEKQRLDLKRFLQTVGKKIKIQEGLSISSNEMVYRFYCASGGLVRYIMNIIAVAQELAAKKDVAVIEMKDFAKAYSMVVCGNSEIAVNPFFEESTDRLQAALAVVAPSPPPQRKRSKATN